MCSRSVTFLVCAAREMSVARFIVIGVRNTSITCSVFEHTIDYTSNT